jgi:hypothetical protein
MKYFDKKNRNITYAIKKLRIVALITKILKTQKTKLDSLMGCDLGNTGVPKIAY